MWASQVALVVKQNKTKQNPPANAGDIRDVGSILGSGREPGKGEGNPPQYSCLENSMDRGSWQLQYIGSQRVGHDWSNLALTHYIIQTLKSSAVKKYVFLCLVRGVPNLFKMRISLLPTHPKNYAPNSALQDIRLEKLIFLWIWLPCLIPYNTELDVHHC